MTAPRSPCPLIQAGVQLEHESGPLVTQPCDHRLAEACPQGEQNLPAASLFLLVSQRCTDIYRCRQVAGHLGVSEARKLCSLLSDRAASSDSKAEAYRVLARLARQQEQGDFPIAVDMLAYLSRAHGSTDFTALCS